MEIQKSHIVRSGAGRDKGKLFMVLAAEGDYLLLADGKSRKLERPKRKKRRHVEFVSDRETRVGGKIREGARFTNSELRRTLAAWRNQPESNGNEPESGAAASGSGAKSNGTVSGNGAKSNGVATERGVKLHGVAPLDYGTSGARSGNMEQEG